MSTYTSSLGLELITPGSQAGLWGNTTNNTFTLIDQAVTGVTPISFASASGSTYTLTDYNGAADEARSAVLNITGSAIGANTVVVPNKQKTYLVRNNTGQDVVFQTTVPTATYTVGAGYSILIFCDGNNNVFTGIASPSVGTLSVAGGGTGTTTFLSGGFVKSAGSTSALTASQYVALGSEVSGTLPVSNGGTGVASITANNLVVGAGTSAVTFIAPGTAGQVLTSNGTVWQAATPSVGVTSVSASLPLSSSGGTTPNISITGQVGVANGGTGVATFAAGFVKSPGLTSNLTTVTSIDLSTSDVSGTLTVGRGGTGAASLTSSALLVGNGTGSITSISPGANGTVLTSNGSAWAAASLPSFVTAVNQGSGITVTGTTSPTVSLSTSGVVAGAYTSANVTVDTYGRITAISNGGGTGVTSFNTRTGAVSLFSSDVTSALGTNPVQYATNVAASGTIASSVTATTQATTDNSTLVATTAYVKNNLANYATTTSLSGYAQLSGATFSGNITAPVHYAGTSGTNSAVLQPQSLNFWSPYTGNAYTSIAFNPSGSAVSQQVYFFAFNNGGSAASNYAFIGDGTAQKLGGGTWSATSDARIKKDVAPLANALDVIDALNPVSFNWKYPRPYESTVGFIAQEVESVLPSAVRDVEPNEDEKRFVQEGEKIKTIGWQNDMIAYLVGAIKELKAEIDALKAAK